MAIRKQDFPDTTGSYTYKLTEIVTCTSSAQSLGDKPHHGRGGKPKVSLIAEELLAIYSW